MAIPNAEDAVVQHEKLTTYLLALSHPVGGSKARFFRAHGFSDENVDLLTERLRRFAGGRPS